MSFDELWDEVVKRSDCFPVVQDREELRHVFNKMKGCKSYLEVGTAEGNSLYLLSHALNDSADIYYVDLGEKHTTIKRDAVVNKIRPRVSVTPILGDSTYAQTIAQAHEAIERHVDCVMIDGGHDYTTVISDAINYAPFAAKYVFFHDICLPEVKAAVSWFIKRYPMGDYYEIINSETFGYGIIEVK